MESYDFHLQIYLVIYPIAGQSIPVTIRALYSARGDKSAGFFWFSVTLLPIAFTLRCRKDSYASNWEKMSATFNFTTAVMGTTLKQMNPSHLSTLKHTDFSSVLMTDDLPTDSFLHFNAALPSARKLQLSSFHLYSCNSMNLFNTQLANLSISLLQGLVSKALQKSREVAFTTAFSSST